MSKIHLLLGAFAVSIVTVLVVLQYQDRLPMQIADHNLNSLHFSAPDVDMVNSDDENLGSLITSYESTTYGYTVRFPSTWNLDDTGTLYAGHLLTDPTEQVYITIDNTAASSVPFDQHSYTKTTWQGCPAEVTSGEQFIGGAYWAVSEHRITRPVGMLTIRVSVPKESAHLYARKIEEIVGSMAVCD